MRSMAVRRVEELGGSVQGERPEWVRRMNVMVESDFFDDPTVVQLGSSVCSDADLSCLHDMPKVHTLVLQNTQLTDAGLAHVGALTQMVTLDLRNTRITDAGLLHLQRLTRMRYLYLSGTDVTADGIAALKRELPALRNVRL
jgi:hypothetical protein